MPTVAHGNPMSAKCPPNVAQMSISLHMVCAWYTLAIIMHHSCRQRISSPQPTANTVQPQEHAATTEKIESLPAMCPSKTF